VSHPVRERKIEHNEEEKERIVKGRGKKKRGSIKEKEGGVIGDCRTEKRGSPDGHKAAPRSGILKKNQKTSVLQGHLSENRQAGNIKSYLTTASR